MAPATSYWPATRSPACSLGVNENGLRHCRQNPSVRPGWPSRERPTAAPHDGHTRLSSGTCGSFRIALAASTAGIAGTVVSPAPRRAPRRRVEEVPTRRVTPVLPRPARAEPRAVDASRLEAREAVEGASPTPAADVAVDPGRAGRARGRACRRRAGRRQRRRERRGAAADVAVAVQDVPGAPRLGAGGGGLLMGASPSGGPRAAAQIRLVRREQRLGAGQVGGGVVEHVAGPAVELGQVGATALRDRAAAPPAVAPAVPLRWSAPRPVRPPWRGRPRAGRRARRARSSAPA